LWLDGNLGLPMLGAELRKRGIEYDNLKKDLVKYGVMVPNCKNNEVRLTKKAAQQLKCQSGTDAA
jgi:hypothetical protein